MRYVLYTLASIAFAFIAFIIWRLGSVVRGARQRDRKIAETLSPLLEKLEPKAPVTADEVATLASQPHLRLMLHAMLKHFNRLELFPEKYLDTTAQGEAQLAYWMMHPNELQDAPEQIELAERLTRKLKGTANEATFFVYRYKMPAGHWAGDDWLLGLAGPYFDGDNAYENDAGAFSRAGDLTANVKPAELIDWYVGMVEQKGALWAQ